MPFFDTRDIEAREVRPGWRGRFVHSAHMTFGYWEVTEGSWIEHEHPEEEVWNVVDGEFEIIIAGESMLARPGVVAVAPANAPTASRRSVTDERSSSTTLSAARSAACARARRLPGCSLGFLRVPGG
jgi:unsaturated pyranuronate lyase